MAKGQAAKQEVLATLLSVFQDSFLYNGGKEIRINTSENGEPVQIKIVATCAKEIVECGGDTAVPGTVKTLTKTVSNADEVKTEVIEATEEEKELVKSLASELGLTF